MECNKCKHGIGYYLKVISKTLETSLQNELAKNDLTYQQLNILIYLRKNIDINVNQKMIEEYFELSSATVSGILKRLEAKKLIIKKTSTEDHRDKYITLSDEGKKVEKEFFNHMKRNDEYVLKGFTKEEENQLIEYLSRIKKNIMEVL